MLWAGASWMWNVHANCVITWSVNPGSWFDWWFNQWNGSEPMLKQTPAPSVRQSQCQRVCWRFRSNPDSVHVCFTHQMWDQAHQCQLRSTTAFSEELWITVNPVGVCWFFISLRFPEGESQALTWIRHCRFCGKRCLAAPPWKGVRGRLPRQQSARWQHGDSTGASGVGAPEGASGSAGRRPAPGVVIRRLWS